MNSCCDAEDPNFMGTIIKANLICPECGFTQELDMPTDACQFFHQCINCKAILKPKPGDCCVFCSYADIPCPPKQREKSVAD